VKSLRAIGIVLLMAAAFCCWLAIRSGPFSGALIVKISTGNLQNYNPAITGIIDNPQFLTVLHALQQRNGTQRLAEPEVTTYNSSYYVNVNRTYYNQKFTSNITNK
jgi:hypothetical protein